MLITGPLQLCLLSVSVVYLELWGCINSTPRALLSKHSYHIPHLTRCCLQTDCHANLSCKMQNMLNVSQV